MRTSIETTADTDSDDPADHEYGFTPHCTVRTSTVTLMLIGGAGQATPAPDDTSCCDKSPGAVRDNEMSRLDAL